MCVFTCRESRPSPRRLHLLSCVRQHVVALGFVDQITTRLGRFDQLVVVHHVQEVGRVDEGKTHHSQQLRHVLRRQAGRVLKWASIEICVWPFSDPHFVLTPTGWNLSHFSFKLQLLNLDVLIPSFLHSNKGWKKKCPCKDRQFKYYIFKKQPNLLNYPGTFHVFKSDNYVIQCWIRIQK